MPTLSSITHCKHIARDNEKLQWESALRVIDSSTQGETIACALHKIIVPITYLWRGCKSGTRLPCWYVSESTSLRTDVDRIFPKAEYVSLAHR